MHTARLSSEIYQIYVMSLDSNSQHTALEACAQTDSSYRIMLLKTDTTALHMVRRCYKDIEWWMEFNNSAQCLNVVVTAISYLVHQFS